MQTTNQAIIKMGKEIKTKLDHNISIAGLLITDADTVNKKAKRAEKGILKGLLILAKRIPSGEVYISNGAEFPNAEAVDLLLYLLWLLEKQGWKETLKIESLNKLFKEVFGIKQSGKIWREKLERLLTIWKNHSFYFPDSFMWHGQKITTQFGVVENWKIIPQGRGKPAILEIRFDNEFINICKNTDWYRRISWLEVRKLRKETAKRLYMLALEYKPDEGKEWIIYINNDLKYWYRNEMNSLADPKYLYPKRILNTLQNAIKEINDKTNLEMKLTKTEEGNYAISVLEVIPAGSEALQIPFDQLSNEEKFLLIQYLTDVVAPKKDIKNIWGFARSLSTRQVKIYLSKAQKHYNKQRPKGKGKETSEQTSKALQECPDLLQKLLEEAKNNWCKDKSTIFRIFFRDGIENIYDVGKELIIKTKDKLISEYLMNQHLKEIENILGKKVKLTHEI